jgi:DNA replication protein
VRGFDGFPSGKQDLVPLPAIFFSELVPQIDHLLELKITLYSFWALHRQEGDFRYIRFSEVCADSLFCAGLNLRDDEIAPALLDAFERATARGTLLHIVVQFSDAEDHLYFFNTDKGRTAVDALENGDWQPSNPTRPLALVRERPNIYTLYEQNIGAITPMISEQLRDLEKEFPATIIKEAIHVAVNSNVRKLSYVLAVLKRWQTDGTLAASGKQDKEFLDFLKSYKNDK